MQVMNTFQDDMLFFSPTPQVGDREDSNVYIGQKLKSALEVGVKAEHIKLAKFSTQYDVSIFNKAPLRTVSWQ